MIRISQIKLKINHTEEELKKQILKALRIGENQLVSYSIVRKSIDARKKDDIRYIYNIDVEAKEEDKILSKSKHPNVSHSKTAQYRFISDGTIPMKYRPVVVGTGPAGLFCALQLAEHGYRPIVLERGEEIMKRVESVNRFWETDDLDPESNVQFGEGGAGTFSDGKLNTMVKDVSGRNRKVLEVFEKYGAPSEILYLHKPHIGTDKLRSVVKNIREEIIRLGGEVLFQSRLTDILIEDKKIQGIIVNNEKEIPCNTLILAIGHSARDTFELLNQRGLTMSQKAFAIGVRIEHLQSLISKSQYGNSYDQLPPADYKLTYQATTGRSIYSFCMCPGGIVVNSSSEKGGLVVNGMSNYARDEANANSALIVSVGPEDFATDSPLAGIEFQRRWEKAAYETGKGKIPIQLYGDLCNKKISSGFGKIQPVMKGRHMFGDLRNCLPNSIIDTLVEGINAFDKKIHGFADEEAVLSGVETRTSSPVRIHRNEEMVSNIEGIYPCGEGAGYAGGITSAAMDGLKVAEAVAGKYMKAL